MDQHSTISSYGIVIPNWISLNYDHLWAKAKNVSLLLRIYLQIISNNRNAMLLWHVDIYLYNSICLIYVAAYAFYLDKINFC